MRLSPQSGFLALCLAALACPAVLQAQQRNALFAGLRPSVAVIDNRGAGFQVAAYLGRPLASQLAGIVELGVTKAGVRRVFYGGFGSYRVDSLPGEIGISLAPGFQLYASAGAQRAAVTVTPGAVWLVRGPADTEWRPADTKPVVPKLGVHCEIGWLLDRGPSVGFSFGLEWWGSNGALPRWVVPFGLTLGLE
jgi:hypothetical protein